MMSFWVVPWSTDGVDAVLLGADDVERQQPGRRRVDRHRRVHAVERDAVEQRVHVALVRHRHADLADLAARELVVGVVAGLRRQVERDREPGLALGEVAAVERVGLAPRSNGRRRCASSRACRARAGGGSCGDSPASGMTPRHAGDRRAAHGQREGHLQLGARRRPRRPRPAVDRGHAAGGARGAEPSALLLTHIHFDHAGAAGALVRRWPDLPVYVHERGRRTGGAGAPCSAT